MSTRSRQLHQRLSTKVFGTTVNRSKYYMSNLRKEEKQFLHACAVIKDKIFIDYKICSEKSVSKVNSFNKIFAKRCPQ